MITLLKPEEVGSYLARLADELNAVKHKPTQPEVKDKDHPPVHPLLDQVRELLASLPPSMKDRISLPMLVPLLQGRYRALPNHVGVATALRKLGYHQIRSYKTADGGTGKRFWIKAQGEQR